MNVNVQIEQLIIDGIAVPFGDRPILQAAVERELARLLVEGGLQPDLMTRSAMAFLNGGGFQMTPGNNPDRLGQQIAQAVYRGIGR